MGKNILYSETVDISNAIGAPYPTDGKNLELTELPESIDVKINGVLQGSFEHKEYDGYSSGTIQYYGGNDPNPYPVFGDDAFQILYVPFMSYTSYRLYIKENGNYTVEISETDAKEDTNRLDVKEALKMRYPEAEGNTIKQILRSAYGCEGRTLAEIIANSGEGEGGDSKNKSVVETLIYDGTAIIDTSGEAKVYDADFIEDATVDCYTEGNNLYTYGGEVFVTYITYQSDSTEVTAGHICMVDAGPVDVNMGGQYILCVYDRDTHNRPAISISSNGKVGKFEFKTYMGVKNSYVKIKVYQLRTIPNMSIQ